MTLEDAARRAVEAAQSAGASDADAWAEESTSRRVRVYAGEVESLSDAGGRGIGVRAFAGTRAGYAYGTDLSDEGVAEVARAAPRGGRARRRGRVRGAAGRDRQLGRGRARVARSFGDWSTERVVELALAVDRAARAPEGVTQVENSVYSDARGSVALANSRGFAASYGATQAWAYSSAFAGEGADLMTGIGVGMGRDPAALDPEAIGTEAAERALALVGARQPESRRCPVVLDAFVAASFIGFIGSMLSADAVQRGRSLFAGPRGRRGGRPGRCGWPTTATDPEGPSSAPFDGEGTPTGRTGLIDGGRLLGFLYDSRTARRAGRSTTGNAEPRLVPDAAVRRNVQPDRRARATSSLAALVAEASRRPVRDRRRRTPFGGQPGLRNLLRRGVRPAHRGRRAGVACARDHNRQRPRLDAQISAFCGLRSALGPLWRQCQGTPAFGRGNGRFRVLSTGKARNKRGNSARGAKNPALSSGCVVTLRPVSCPRQGGKS